MNRIIKIMLIFAFTIFFTSCEGFKVLTIQNLTDSDARFIFHPGINLGEYELSNTHSFQTDDSTVIILQPDSSIRILSEFTSLLFNRELKANEIPFDYLRIESKSDTLIFKSIDEIMNLFNFSRNDKSKDGRKYYPKIVIE